MSRTVRGFSTAWLQPEGTGEPETNPTNPWQRNSQFPYMPKSCYNLDIDYEGSESKNEPFAQEEKEENSDAKYSKMEIPHHGTLGSSMYIEN